jgi:hypothetical protein
MVGGRLGVGRSWFRHEYSWQWSRNAIRRGWLYHRSGQITCPEYGSLQWRRFSGQALAVVIDSQTAIKSLVDFDMGMGIAWSPIRGYYLEAMFAKAHYVVCADGALVLETKHRV